MTDAPERIAIKWVEGAAITSGPLMQHSDYTHYVRADRIEELEAENHLLKTSGIVEVAVRNPNVSEYIRHWEGRAETAEAKLAKAVRLIKLSVELGRWDLNPSLRDEMIDFTTELTGETNE